MGCGQSSLAGVDAPGDASEAVVSKRGGVDADAFGDERVSYRPRIGGATAQFVIHSVVVRNFVASWRRRRGGQDGSVDFLW